METVMEVLTCSDGSCCCMEPKISIILISALNVALCVVDLITLKGSDCCPISAFLENLRIVIVSLFLMANILLLFGGFYGNLMMLRVYVWYAMSFVVIGLTVSICDLLMKFVEHGLYSFVAFIPEVLFLFALYMCIPLVENFKKQVQNVPIVVEANYHLNKREF